MKKRVSFTNYSCLITLVPFPFVSQIDDRLQRCVHQNYRAAVELLLSPHQGSLGSTSPRGVFAERQSGSCIPVLRPCTSTGRVCTQNSISDNAFESHGFDCVGLFPRVRSR